MSNTKNADVNSDNETFEVSYETYNTLPDTLNAKVQMINARNTAKSLDKEAPETIQVMDIMAEVGVNNKSGLPCQRTYLFCADGSIYFTQSQGIAKTINEFYHTFGDQSFTELPLGYAEMRVVSRPLADDKTYKQMELIKVE